MMRRLLILLLLAAALPATAQDRASQRYNPGNSLCVAGVTLDACAPSYAPPSGNYSILYTGSGSPKGTDDFNILIFTGSSPATYTFPPSTSSVFPAGHGAGIKNLGAAPLTVTATTSTISGAPGVVNGSPATLGGAFVLFPGGEAWVSATPANNYIVTGFLAGTWYQFANNQPALQWTGLSGYAEYDLHCSGLVPALNGDTPSLQFAYNGTFQATGYHANQTHIVQSASSTPASFGSDTATNIPLTYQVTSTGSAINAHLTFAQGFGGGSRNTLSSTFNEELSATGLPERYGIMFGAGPYSTATVTGIQIFNDGTGSNLASGLCWLRPSL